MANRVLINDLPKYPVCTISELVNGAPSQHSQPHQDHLNRRIVKLPNGREILVVLHPITNEVFAMDRFCYHHGYPLENGDIEDIAAFETMNDSSKKDENEIAKNNARRGEGQVIPRQKGPLKFNKEEHLKAMSKSLQSQQNTSAATNSKETAPSSSNDVDYKSIQPGQLEVDFEDPSKFQSDDPAYFPIITCTLHNRIFDFRTGDMISRSVVRKTVNKNGKEVPEDDEAAAGEQKCLISESTGCHQRIHPISIERENNDKNDNNNNDNDNNNNHDGVIFFHDTFGYSVPMRRPGSKVNMEDRSHLMFLAKKKVLSDKENKEMKVVEKKEEVK